jgi:predicted kinase
MVRPVADDDPPDLATQQQEDLGSQFSEQAAPHPKFFGGLMSFGENEKGDGWDVGPLTPIARGADQGILYGAATLSHGLTEGMTPAMHSRQLARYGYAPTDDRPDKDKESEFEKTARGMADTMAPDPLTAGTAFRVLQSLSEFGTKIALGAPAGPAGMFSTTAGISYYETYHQLRDQGVDDATAQRMAQVDAGISGTFAITGGAGSMLKTSTLATKMLSEAAAGVAQNVPLGIAGRYMDHSILENAGYHDLAEQQKPWDGLSLLTDIGMGLVPAAFAGTHAAYQGMADVARSALKDRGLAQDAADVVNQKKGISNLAPGVPVDSESAAFHNTMIDTATRQNLAGEKVDSSQADLPGSATFAARPQTDHEAMVQAFSQHLHEAGFTEELGGLDKDTKALIERTTGQKLAEPERTPEFAPAQNSLDRAVDGPPVDRLDLANFGLPEPPRPLPDGHELLQPHDADTSPERVAMRSSLIDERFADAKPVAAGKKPIALVMGGGGASGKGTILKLLQERGDVPPDAVHLDPDSFKTGDAKKGWHGIPEYQQINAAGDSRSASTVHEESSAIYDTAVKRAVSGRYNVVLDRTLGDPVKASRELQRLKDAGYDIHLVGVSVHPEEAITRAVKRAQGPEKRFVPLHALLEAHKGFSEGWEHLSAMVKKATLFDNNVKKGTLPVMMATRAGPRAAMEIHDQKRYNQFAEKAHLNDKATTLREIAGAKKPATDDGAEGRLSDASVHPSGVGQGAEGDRRGGSLPSFGSPDSLAAERLEPKAGNKIVSTATGRQVEVRSRLAEAGQLIASDHPDYPQELQPRQRADRKALTEQVTSIAGHLNPERLGDSAEADRGSPIVSHDNIVESGNGRVMALREVYKNNEKKAAEYRAYLESQGHDTSKFANPVLVRERVTPMGPGERRAFAVESNQSSIASLSPVERAHADAMHLDAGMLDLLRPGEIHSSQNSSFVRAFLGKLPQSERNELLEPDGRLSQAGVRRIQAAILAKAYGGNDSSNATLGRMLESTDNDLRSTLGAMIDAAPAMAGLRRAIEEGKVAKTFDVTVPLAQAVEEVGKLRSKGENLNGYLKVSDMFGDRAPIVEALMRAMYDRAGTRMAGRDKVAERLMEYAHRASKELLDQHDMLGDRGVTPEALLAPKPEDAPLKPSEDMFGLRTPQGAIPEPETATPKEPPSDASNTTTANQALSENDQMKIPNAQGDMVPASDALGQATLDEAQAKLDAEKGFQAAADCFKRQA